MTKTDILNRINRTEEELRNLLREPLVLSDGNTFDKQLGVKRLLRSAVGDDMFLLLSLFRAKLESDGDRR